MSKPKPGYSNWLTKQQAADAIGVSTKTIEKICSEGELQAVTWKRPEGGNPIVVYHPKDVERIRKERNPDAGAFVLPPDNAAAVAVRSLGPGRLIPVQAMYSQNHEKHFSEFSKVRLSERLYLTLPESAEYTGLGVGYLKKLVDNGTLAPLKGAGPHGASVYRRADLEKL